MRAFQQLLALRQRRDWLQLTMWIGGTMLLAWSSYVGVADSYGTAEDRQNLLLTVFANPVILLFRGLPSGADAGAFMLFLIFPFLAMMAAFMSTFLAVRHTRAEEESGRAELVGASGAGRLTPLWATIAHGTLANLVLGVLTALTLLELNQPAAGSWISGLAAGAVGFTFLGIGLVAGQLLPTPRSANSVSVWLLMLTFVFAGIGNAMGTAQVDQLRIESSWLAWLSPFGWGENTRPFAENNWWPVLLSVAVGVLLVGVAVALQASRDLGASWLPERQGRASARPALSGATALVWRLNWGAIVGWAVGGLLTGVLATAMASALQDAASSLPSVQAIMNALTANGSIEQGAIVIFFTMLGILAAAAAVQVLTKARQEEVHGTAELLLATPVSRTRWLAGYVLVAFEAIVITIAAAVLGALLGLASQANPDWSLIGDVLVVGAGQAVAATVFLAITALVFVLLPRWTIGLGWTLLMVGLTLGLFGPLFGMPDWLVHLAPISSAPTVTSTGVDLQGLVWLLLAIVLAGGASALFMRRRELASE